MTRSKDIKKMAEIAAEYAKGSNINQIAQKVGMTRQTVSTYLRTPELQKAVDSVQEGLVGVLAKALDYLDKVVSGKIQDIDMSRLKVAMLLADKLGSKVIAQTPVTSQAREVSTLTPEERQAKLIEIKTLIEEESKDAIPVEKPVA